VNVLLLTSHAIAERDDLDMFTRMGVPCYSIGGAYDDVPFEGKRPAVPNVVRYPELEAATIRQREQLTERHGAPGPYIDWAKASLAPEVIAWADTIIVHHFPDVWVHTNWPRIKGKRVIWRTCGQSNPMLEKTMRRFRAEGLEIVRYSPHEEMVFGRRPDYFAGSDAIIRFGKDPDEWSGWTGHEPFIANVTQDMAGRAEACGLTFYLEATANLPARPAGPRSDLLPGGVGSLDYEEMRAYLRASRAYLYTGTQPASYTLGLIEAMMTGTPVVSIGAADFGTPLFEPIAPVARNSDEARAMLRALLDDPDLAAAMSENARQRAIQLFDLDAVSRDWARFLGVAA